MKYPHPCFPSFRKHLWSLHDVLGPMLGAGNTKRHRLIPGGDRQLMCVLTGQGGVAVQSA